MGCGSSAQKDKAVDKALPEDFPKDIDADFPDFVNWAQDTFALDVLTCYPKDETAVAKVVNWAAKKGWKVRPIGVKHNWSPITIVDQGRKKLDKVLLVSLKNMTKVTVTPAKGEAPPHAVVQLGCGQLEFLTALEKAQGGTGTIGFGLVHTPAPDSITVGGMLAIDGHGTAIPCDEEDKIMDRKTANYGTYSNLMLACRAVVWDDAKSEYVVKEFRRENGQEIAPFLTHVGRAFLTEATLQVQPNYYMRCTSRLDIDWKTMFAAQSDPRNPQENSMMYFIKKHGRAEAIWFPFTDNPWLKVWQVTDEKKPEGCTEVHQACNYPFSDQLGDNLTTIYRHMTGSYNAENDKLLKEIHKEIKEEAEKNQGKPGIGKAVLNWFDEAGNDIASAGATVIGGPGATPFVTRMTWARVLTGLAVNHAGDIWGPSKNTLVYVRDTTLRVTANGYTVMTNIDNVQQCMHVFADMYYKLLHKYADQGKYPISCPLEIRVTGLDDPTPIGGSTLDTFSPPLSAMHIDADAKANNWNIALWLDVLSLPGAPNSNEFYAEMELLMLDHPTFNGKNGRIRPEWSKGWGYTQEGPWKSQKFLDHTRQALPQWNEMMAEYRRHDPKNLYSNPWMETFFADVAPAKKAAPVDDGAYDLRTRQAVIAGRAPIAVKVEAGQTYYWCVCGKSKSQPFCDGSHQGTEFKPMPWTATETKDVYFCACKQTKTAPFCDGTHVNLPAIVAPAPTEAAPVPSKLEKNGELRVDAELRSANGAYRLIMQGDGNLVLYEGDKPVWASATNGKTVTHAAVDKDGEFGVYNGGERIWSCGAKGEFVVLQDDRNFVLYAEGNAATWATGTNI